MLKAAFALSIRKENGIRDKENRASIEKSGGARSEERRQKKPRANADIGGRLSTDLPVTVCRKVISNRCVRK
jgi:hypothetical protein